jgi:hypothetical protein
MRDLYGLKVSELDDILDKLGLDKSGLKADKQKRLEKYYLETPMAGAETPEVVIDEPEREVIPSLTPYTIRMWCGIKPVYVCTLCDRQEDSEDDAILHFLSHYPEEEREYILDNIVKDK